MVLVLFKNKKEEKELGKPILVTQNGFPQAPSQEENIRKTDSDGINLSEGGKGKVYEGKPIPNVLIHNELIYSENLLFGKGLGKPILDDQNGFSQESPEKGQI